MRRSTPVLLLLLLLTACAARPGATGDEPALVVFAASSLTDALTEVGARYEAQVPGRRVTFNFAGSQQLAQQLVQGAPADLFASANENQLTVAVAGGRIDGGAARPFARNRLVAIYPPENPAGLAVLADLARPGVKLVLANEAVPAGAAARALLDRAAASPAFGAGFQAGVMGNVVSYEENVRAVLSKVLLGEADAGIVYVSDVAGAHASEVGQLEIPVGLNVITTYPVAPLIDSVQPNEAAAFIDLLLSAEGQAILARHGFLPVAE